MGVIRTWIGGMALGAVVVSTGCTHVYVPRESKHTTEQIPMYTVASKVEFKNGQPNDTEILFAENMGHDFMADLKDWTDVAIEIAERELNERGAANAPKSGASLTLKVTKAGTTTGGWGFRGNVTMEVTTGMGLKRTYNGTAGAANLYNATSGALAHAVTQMLSDQYIMVYLQQ